MHNSPDHNSGVKTLIEYDIDESVDIKEETIQDEEVHQWEKHNLLSGKNQLDEKYTTTEISSNNNCGAMTLTEYDCDETLEIKQEIIHDTTEADIMTVKKPRTFKKKKLQESKSKPKKKYKCGKCARSYAQRQSLYKHKKFECDVVPQFSCEFCSKRFKRESNMKQHVCLTHQKTTPKTSQERHKCDKCSRSYVWIRDLNNHKRLKHAVVKPQFICDYCDHKTNQKELKLTLQTKRRAHSSGEEIKKRAKKEEGSPDDEEESDSSHSNHPGGLTPEDKERRRRRRERNKIAATKCRLKKREKTVILDQESEILETQNRVLKTQIQELETQRRRLVDMLSLHLPTCLKHVFETKKNICSANRGCSTRE